MIITGQKTYYIIDLLIGWLMTARTAQKTVAVIVAMLLVAGVFVALPTLAQEGDGITTPEPQEDGDYDCGQFETREQVNAVFDPSNDQYELDRDGDGIACENVGEPSEDEGTPTDEPTDEETTDTPTEEETTEALTEEETTDTPTEEETTEQQEEVTEQPPTEDQQTADEEQKDDMKEDTEQTEDTQTEDKKETPC